MGNSIKQLSNIETAAFCEQMGMILNAGISPLEGISVMKEDAATNEAKAILSTIEKTYTEGATFHQSLVSANVFPAYALNLIRIGEDSGNLEEVMNSLSYHYEREESIKSGIKNAVTYPFIIIGMMAVVILVLIINVMPVFNDVFAQLGSSLDGVSAGCAAHGVALALHLIDLTAFRTAVQKVAEILRHLSLAIKAYLLLFIPDVIVVGKQTVHSLLDLLGT